MHQISTARLRDSSRPSPNGGIVTHQIAAYAANPLFGDCKNWVIENNPFRRPVRPQDLEQYSFTEPVSADALGSGSGLCAQRMLLNIYETELTFLPAAKFAGVECVHMDVDVLRVQLAQHRRLAGAGLRMPLRGGASAGEQRERKLLVRRFGQTTRCLE